MSYGSLSSLGQHFILISIRDENKLFIVLIPFLTRLQSDCKSPLPRGAQDGLAGASAADEAFISCLPTTVYYW